MLAEELAHADGVLLLRATAYWQLLGEVLVLVVYSKDPSASVKVAKCERKSS